MFELQLSNGKSKEFEDGASLHRWWVSQRVTPKKKMNKLQEDVKLIFGEDSVTTPDKN